MMRKQIAQILFEKIGKGKENSVPRPEDKQTDRALRKIVEDARNKGAVIINVGQGYYIPRPDVAKEVLEFNEFMAKQKSRADKIIQSADSMRRSWEKIIQEQLFEECL